MSAWLPSGSPPHATSYHIVSNRQYEQLAMSNRHGERPSTSFLLGQRQCDQGLHYANIQSLLAFSYLVFWCRPRLLFHSGDVNVQRAQASFLTRASVIYPRKIDILNMQDLTRAAASAGADAVLIVAPCIMKPASLDMLVEVCILEITKLRL